jgi:hypothetical protein
VAAKQIHFSGVFKLLFSFSALCSTSTEMEKCQVKGECPFMMVLIKFFKIGELLFFFFKAQAVLEYAFPCAGVGVESCTLREAFLSWV